MKSRQKPQSATALPTSPEEDERSRTRTYLITMGIRIACLVLMVVVRPYGWYSFVFAAGAIFLPYIAVVMANAGRWGASGEIRAVTRGLEAGPAGDEKDSEPETGGVWRVTETRSSAPPASGSDPGTGTAEPGAREGEERP